MHSSLDLEGLVVVELMQLLHRSSRVLLFVAQTFCKKEEEKTKITIRITDKRTTDDQLPASRFKSFHHHTKNQSSQCRFPLIWFLINFDGFYEVKNCKKKIVNSGRTYFRKYIFDVHISHTNHIKTMFEWLHCLTEDDAF